MKIFNSIQAEVIKTINTSVSWIALSAGIFIPLFSSLIYYNTSSQAMRETLMEVPWQARVLGEISSLIALILSASAILITGMVMYIETKNDTWKHLLTTPRTIMDIHLSKFLVVQYHLLKCFVVIALLVSIFILLNNHLDIHIIKVYQNPRFEVFLPLVPKLYMALIPVTVMQYILSKSFRNVLFPIGFGLMIMICSLLIGNDQNAAWFPYMYPREEILNVFDPSRKNVEELNAMTDLKYTPQVKKIITDGRMPHILFDQAHGNRHVAYEKNMVPGSYHPFVRLSEGLGCKMDFLENRISENTLDHVDLFITACPFDENNEPFEDHEISIIKKWVMEGGQLFIITDHHPFGLNAAELARAFDIEFTFSTVLDHAQGDKLKYETGRIIYNIKDDHHHALLKDVKRVITYTGQGVKKSGGPYEIILPFSDYAYYEDSEGNHNAANGYSQLITCAFGKGRLIVTGEAGFLTAQIKGEELIGINCYEYDNEKTLREFVEVAFIYIRMVIPRGASHGIANLL